MVAATSAIVRAGGCRRLSGRIKIQINREARPEKTKKGGKLIKNDTEVIRQQERINAVFRQLTAENKKKAISYFENLKGGLNSPQVYPDSPG